MQQPRYFARTLHGLEDFTAQDITTHARAKIITQSHRTIQFSSELDPSDLLMLRSVEDLFITLGNEAGITHERSSLKTLSEWIKTLSLKPALDVCRSQRSFSEQVEFSVTASFVGARNYNRWELAESLAAPLVKRHGWKFIDNRSGPAPEHDVHLRLIIEEEEALLGMRLANHPLHKRPYKHHHLEASLSPVLAYHLVRAAEIRPFQSLLDPFCGVATIPIEAALAEPEAIVVGTDINEEAIHLGQENADAANAPVSLAEENAFDLKLEPASIDAIVTDLPWGEQSKLNGGELSDLIRGFSKVLKPSGRLVLLYANPDALTAVLEQAGYVVKPPILVSVHGKHPGIVRAQRVES